MSGAGRLIAFSLWKLTLLPGPRSITYANTLGLQLTLNPTNPLSPAPPSLHPCTPLQDAITDWQTSQGTMMHLDGMAGHYTPQQVEEVKMVLRLMPVFFTTMLYW